VKGWLRISALAAAAGLLASGLALAQGTTTDDSQQQDERQRSDNNSLAVGAGLVNADSQTQPYLMAALRLRIGHHHQQHDSEDWRGHPPDTGIRGYFEPEIAYWKAGSDQGGGKDQLIGFNLIGVIPLGPVDSFFGAGAAYHRIDQSILLGVPTATGTEGKVGVDAQFGIDLYLNRSLSLFGAGRFDLVQDLRRGVEGKAYLGLRARF